MSDKNSKLVIAVDLGATNVRVALVDGAGTVVKRLRELTAREGKSGRVVTGQVIRMIEQLLAERGVRQRVKAIGVSSIGPLDYKKGGPVNSPNVPFAFVPLVGPLEQKFSLPVFLFNDANAAVMAEKRFGAGRTFQNIVYITMSSGIGGGAIIDDRLLLGRGGNAAEIGHIIADTTYSLDCGCAKGKGHWEGYASGNNIPRFFAHWATVEQKKVNFQYENAKAVFDQAIRGNKIAGQFIDVLAKVNGRAVSNITAAYDPDIITFGGSVALNNRRFVIGGIKKYVDHFLKIPQLKITSLGEDITLLGAAAGAFEGLQK